MAKQDIKSRKRELNKKIAKYVDQLPLWDLLKIFGLRHRNLGCFRQGNDIKARTYIPRPTP